MSTEKELRNRIRVLLARTDKAVKSWNNFRIYCDKSEQQVNKQQEQKKKEMYQ